MDSNQSEQPSILSQDRKQLIMEKLKQERQQRKQEFLKKTQQSINSPATSEQQLEYKAINDDKQQNSLFSKQQVDQNQQNENQQLDWNNIVNINTETMRKISDNNNISNTQNQNQNQNLNNDNVQTQSKSQLLQFNIQKYQNKFKNQLNNLDIKNSQNNNQNQSQQHQQSLQQQTNEVNQYIDKLIQEQLPTKNDQGQLTTQQGKNSSLRNSTVQMTQEEAFKKYRQLQQNNMEQQKTNIYDYPQLSKASPKPVKNILSPKSSAKSGQFLQNNQNQFKQFQEEQKGFWSHKKQIAENQYLNVQKLMFGNNSEINTQRQFRSRSNDSDFQQQSKLKRPNNFISNKKTTKRYNSQSPSQKKFTIQDLSNIDFEFQDQNPDQAKVINDLLQKHGQKQGYEKITELQRRTEEEYINQQKFPFKPQINELPRDIYNWDEKQQLEISKEEQWNRILVSKKEIQDQREILKIQQDAQYIQEHCTFQPEINQISNLLTKKDKYQQNISERLYQQGIDKIKQLDKIGLKQKAEQEFLYNHPFRPDVQESIQKLSTNAAFQKPLFQRVDEVVKDKQEQQIKLQMQYNEQEKHPFKPQINETSQKIHEYKVQTNQIESKDFIERMMKDALRKIAQKQQNEELLENQLSEQCTFKPSLVSIKNEQILENNVFFQQETDFVKRQQLMQDYINEKLDLKKDNYQKQNPYKPQINQISKYLVETDEQRAVESNEDKLIRLAIKDREKKEIVKEQLQKAYYDQYSYQPKLNPISKQLGVKHNLEELTDIKSRNEKINMKKAEIEKQQLQECSFRPNTNKKKKFEQVKSKYSARQDNNISVQLQDTQLEKERKKEQLKQIIEYEEMKECTFKPITNNNVIKNENVQVRGMDKYMQYRQLHKKQKMEQKEREIKLFNLERNYDIQKHQKQTENKEFQLSKNNPKKMQQLRQEYLEKEREVCTFQPQTNESKNKAMIKKILEEQNQNQNHQIIEDQQYQNISNLQQQQYHNKTGSISQNFTELQQLQAKENIQLSNTDFNNQNPYLNSNYKFSQNDIIQYPNTGPNTLNNFFQHSANKFNQDVNNFEKPDIQQVKEWMKKQDILTNLEKQFKLQPSPQKETNYEEIQNNYSNNNNNNNNHQQDFENNQQNQNLQYIVQNPIPQDSSNNQQFQYQVFRPNIFQNQQIDDDGLISQ